MKALLIALLMLVSTQASAHYEGWVNVNGRAVLYETGIAVAEVSCNWGSRPTWEFYHLPLKYFPNLHQVTLGGEKVIGRSPNSVVLSLYASEATDRVIEQLRKVDQYMEYENTVVKLPTDNFSKVAMPVIEACMRD